LWCWHAIVSVEHITMIMHGPHGFRVVDVG